MAYACEAAGFGGHSGVLGNVVMVRTEGGTIVRSRPSPPRRRTPGQIAQGDRLEICNRVWQAMSREEAALWRGYALERAAALPTGSRKRMASAQSLFSGLGSKFLQVHGGEEVPRVPPTGRFLGDAIGVTAEGGSGLATLPLGGVGRAKDPTQRLDDQGLLASVLNGIGEGAPEIGEAWNPTPTPPQGEGLFLRFVADGANREGVVTELMAQPLTCAHNRPRIKSYVSLGFVAMQAGVPVEVPVSLSLHWACAVRFVEAATGRMTDIIEIGTAVVQ